MTSSPLRIAVLLSGSGTSLENLLERIDAGDVQRVEKLVGRAKLPTREPGGISAERMLELMAVDKKLKGGKLRLVLLEAIGKADLTGDFDPAALEETLEECRDPA